MVWLTSSKTSGAGRLNLRAAIVTCMIGRADVAIVGGGVIGSAIADLPRRRRRLRWATRRHRARSDLPDRASSALSASSIRQQFSTPENIRMSRFGFAFLRDVGRLVAVGDGPAPEIGLAERGYLYLAPPGAETTMREATPSSARRGSTSSARRLTSCRPGFRGCPWRASRSARSGCRARAGSMGTG